MNLFSPTSRRSLLIRLSWYLTILHVLCTNAFAADAREEGAPFNRTRERDRVRVTLMAGIVWEGATLRKLDLDALESLRERFPNQSFTHFVSPAYLLRRDAPSQAAATIARVMRPGDGVALHASPWKSIVTRAGVLFRDGPTFWGNKLSPSECAIDCGREVPLSIYPPADVRKIVATSASVLDMYGFGKTRAVQVGGWMASQSVMEQLAAIGLVMDFSSVAPASVKPRLGRFPIFNWIRDIWSDEQPAVGPTMIMTPQGQVTTYPANGGLVDQHTVADISAAFDRLISGTASASLADRYFYLGMYQETAARFAERFAVAMESIQSMAASRNVVITTIVPQGGRVPASTLSFSH